MCDFIARRSRSRNMAAPDPRHEAGERIDQGGLAGTVRTDEEVQPPLPKGEIDALDGLEAVEVHGEVADLQVSPRRS